MEKGLTFVPNRKILPISNIINDRNNLLRHIKLKSFFQNLAPPKKVKKDPAPPGPLRKFTNKSNWEPDYFHLDAQTQKLVDEIRLCTAYTVENLQIQNNTIIKLQEKHNLTKNEFNSIKVLKNNPNIIIKKADKGNATVIMNLDNYITEANNQLSDTKYYKQLTEPIYKENIPRIRNILNNLLTEKYITLDQYNYLSGPEIPRERIFYLLPKIHKDPNSWPQPKVMPPGRPIVSDVNSETYRISSYIDSFLNPLGTRHDTYIKNTFDFLTKIRHFDLEQEYILVTGDITSLYTNMNIDRSLHCVNEIFKLYPDTSRPDKHILELLEISLHYNDFNFNNKFYLQTMGTAMGKRFAPALANIYLLEFDKNAQCNFEIKPKLFFRYLDDIFFLWPKTFLKRLPEFEAFLNNLIPDISVKLEYSDKEIHFLDTTIFIHNNTLQSKVYFKSTDTHQLLHKDSFHPRHTFRGLIKSQLIRYKRLSSFQEDYNDTCKTLFSILKRRGYSFSELKSLQYEIWHNHSYNTTNKYTSNRNSTTKQNNNTDKELLPIIIDFNTVGQELALKYKNILKNYENILHITPIIAYKSYKNLGQLLTSSKLKNNTITYAFNTCNSLHCLTCKLHTCSTEHFNSTYNKQKYTFSDNLYCHTKSIIYLITCTLCNKQYIGETSRSLRERISDHRHAITHNKPTTIGLHFNTGTHKIHNLHAIAIECILTGETNRKNREKFWQDKLKTIAPFGLNGKLQ